jgi:hypothetical protein
VPATQVVFYQEATGDSPVANWLIELRATQRKAYFKCRAALGRLVLLGHELRRPEADYLGDGLHELRVRFGSVNYRFLYFFHGQNIAVVALGLTKETTIPAADLARALARKAAYTADPATHSFTGDLDHA